MARTDQDPELAHLLPGGQNDVPNIDPRIATPCRNEEVSGRRLPNGEVIDLWFGEYGGGRHSREAYREAAKLCWSICAVEHPEAFAACARYQATFKPRHGVFGGVIPGEELTT